VTAGPTFSELAATPDPDLDRLALALAAEFRTVDARSALASLDDLGAELADTAAAAMGDPAGEAEACAAVLGDRHGFEGNREDYHHPDNSMLDRVLERRKGLPIVLSIVYVEAARRAGLPLHPVGLPGHFLVAHFGSDPPLMLDPFAGGRPLNDRPEPRLVRPWGPHETALRMLNNLVHAYTQHPDLTRAIHAAELRLALPAAEDLRVKLEAEARGLRARLN
jgi:regulator of sirC expression with transglutaminase-like and TPR domain